MKLTENFYTSTYGIGGLVADLPTKNPKKKNKEEVHEFNVGDMVQCEAEGFLYPFRGYIEKILTHTALIRIENTMKSDAKTAKEKCQIAVVRIKDIQVMDLATLSK